MTTKYKEHQDAVHVIDQYYDALVDYAFLDTQAERDNNPYLIEIGYRIMTNNLNHDHQIKTEFYGILTPYEYVVKMRHILFDSYDENRHESPMDISEIDISEIDSESGWITIDDDEYDTLRREELRMIRDYYDKLVDIFTLV